MIPVQDRSFNLMFSIFPIFFFVVFLLIISMIVYAIVSSVRRNHKNNNSPVLTVDATVVSKRTNISHHHHNSMNSMDHVDSSTWYYVTFQVESGDRMELSVMGTDYGMLIEGDVGRLTFQGTRFLGFERRR